jgi:pyruvate/2-oxoglutarate dehydrogenase complex dihydrolipoamide acyltransferase (E2) component
MAVEFKLPPVGEGVESGEVLSVMIAEGDTLTKDQEILEFETDKATAFISIDQPCTVSKIHFAEGDTLEIGQVILTIEPSGASAPAPGAAKPAAPPTPAKPPAQAVKATPPVAPVEPVAPVAPVAPVTPVAPVAAVPTATPSAARSSGKHIPAGPAIRRFAREVGVNLSTVAGTGESGRITRDDVLKIVREGAGSRGTGATPVAAGTQSDGFGPVHIEKMPKIRKTIAKKMHESWTTCPRVTNFDDADVTQLEGIRQSSKQDYAAEGIKLTTMPFLIKAIAMALKLHPVINASIDMEQGQIIYKDYVNIGIAVDTERGLVVPSLRDADKLSIPQIARELGTMAENVRNNNFSIDDLRGGTFTISNLGAIGGTYSTPIINTPETAIILVGRSRKMPVVIENDEVVVRLMMPLSISYDHRLIDGGAAARFLNEVIGYLEAPSRLLLAI